MQNKPRWLSTTILILAGAAAMAASAAGLGAGSSAAVLGQPLDFQVQVRLEADETLTAECVAAEVSAGDRVLPPGQVRTQIESQAAGSARIRVLTLNAIEEPVVGIRLGVGCTARLTRHYVVLADPPAAPLAAPEAAALPALPDVASAAQSATPAVGSGAAPADAPGAAPAAPARSAELRAQANPASQPTARAKPRAAAEPPVARVRSPQPRPAVRSTPTPDSARLKLDFAEPVLSAEAQAVEQAIEVVAQAASAARMAATAASAADARIASLEQTVEKLRQEARASRDLAAQFRERLSHTEGAGAGAWMLPLMLLALGLALLAAWLAWRLGRVQSVQRREWRAQQTPPAAVAVADVMPSKTPTAPIPFVTSEIHVPAAPPPVAAGAANRARGARAWPPPAPLDPWATLPPPPSTLAPDTVPPPEPPAMRTLAMPALAHADEGAPRDVSIEELIDLEQQAEFFVVLGQDDAAIDLLVEHLRSTGGGSPLPYLKLLEIHHRRPDREAYERLRARFNHRFNAYAPEWGADLQDGRSLDDYAGVVPRLQAVWPRPLDAMAELEALLFRKSRGELFDLPAYREVLFLYSIARDLLDHDAAETGEVDLLLPMATSGEFSATSPAPFAMLGEGDAPAVTEIDDRPTAPLDFDLSLAEKPTSIFDPLDITQPFKRR